MNSHQMCVAYVQKNEKFPTNVIPVDLNNDSEMLSNLIFSKNCLKNANVDEIVSLWKDGDSQYELHKFDKVISGSQDQRFASLNSMTQAITSDACSCLVICLGNKD